MIPLWYRNKLAVKEAESKTNLLDISIVSIISWTREICTILQSRLFIRGVGFSVGIHWPRSIPQPLAS